MTIMLDQPLEQGILLDYMSWDFYERLLEEVSDRHIFVTYDQGRLEIMSPSWKHERYAGRVAMIVRIVAMELGIKFLSGDSTTFKLRSTEAGLEPDNCFYIQNVQAMIGKDSVDLATDPPPDLAIEIEVSRRLADRIEVYRRLGVPEVWLEDERSLRILRLVDGAYEPAKTSAAIPSLLPEQIHSLVVLSETTDEGTWIASIQDWVRQNLLSA
jgi:Uma2 family endonuclease